MLAWPYPECFSQQFKDFFLIFTFLSKFCVLLSTLLDCPVLSECKYSMDGPYYQNFLCENDEKIRMHHNIFLQNDLVRLG